MVNTVSVVKLWPHFRCPFLYAAGCKKRSASACGGACTGVLVLVHTVQPHGIIVQVSFLFSQHMKLFSTRSEYTHPREPSDRRADRARARDGTGTHPVR